MSNIVFNRCRIKQFCLLTLFSLSLFPCRHSFAQGYAGIRITPNLTAVPKVFNNSPANISTGTTTALEAGIDYTFMVNKHWGLSAGTDFGGSNWSYNFKAPAAAFNPGTAGGEVNLARFHNYLYNSATLNAVYKIPFRGSNIRVFAGPTVRIHHSERVGSSRGVLNHDSQYLNDPTLGFGVPDFLMVYPGEPHLLTILSTGIGYEHSVNNKLDVLLGLRANLGLQTMSKSIMTINMYNQLYRGSINTSSNYLGFDLAFRLKTTAKPSKQKP